MRLKRPVVIVITIIINITIILITIMVMITIMITVMLILMTRHSACSEACGCQCPPLRESGLCDSGYRLILIIITFLDYDNIKILHVIRSKQCHDITS